MSGDGGGEKDQDLRAPWLAPYPAALTPHASPPPLAVVTGSRGFIGSHLVEALVALGVRVRCLIRAGTTAELSAVSGGAIEQCVVDYDDPRTLERSGVLDGVTHVFHVGGVTKGVSQREFDAGNVAPTARLIDALATRADTRLERFVLLSSQAAAGPARALDAPRNESQTAEPIEEYGRSKLKAEQVVASRGDRISFTILRPSAVYGPRDRDFLTIFRQARRGVGLYPASRDRHLSVIHVRDVVRGILAAGASPLASRQTYFLTAEPAVSWRDIYRAVAEAIGRPVSEINIPQPLVDAAGILGDLHAMLTGTASLVTRQKVALSKADYWICSGEKAARELGFRASIALREGMRETYRWYLAQGWVGV